MARPRSEPVTIPGLQRITTCCAAPGKRGHYGCDSALDIRLPFSYIRKRIKSRSEGRRRQTLSRRRERVRFSSRGGPAALSEKPRWSAGRRSAPEAGGSRKRIVLWRAPRPKRERVVTLARVARPRLWRLPALHFPLPFGEEFFERGVGKPRTLRRAARTGSLIRPREAGRGTMRSMVEGPLTRRFVVVAERAPRPAPLPPRKRAVPLPPFVGEENC